MPLDVRIVSDLGSYDYRIENALHTEYYDFRFLGTRLRVSSSTPTMGHECRDRYRGGRSRRPAVSPRFSDSPATPILSIPLTTIEFELTGDDFVRLEVYDLAGRRVRELLAEPRPPGRHAVVWDGRGSESRELPSGTYLRVCPRMAWPGVSS